MKPKSLRSIRRSGFSPRWGQKRLLFPQIQFRQNTIDSIKRQNYSSRPSKWTRLIQNKNILFLSFLLSRKILIFVFSFKSEFIFISLLAAGGNSAGDNETFCPSALQHLLNIWWSGQIQKFQLAAVIWHLFAQYVIGNFLYDTFLANIPMKTCQMAPFWPMFSMQTFQMTPFLPIFKIRELEVQFRNW